MTYAEAIKFLYGLSWFGARFGLEPTRALAAAVGDPQLQLRFIHVAGTNGKGSTCAMLESIYRHAGLRVGLFTSPHLVSFRERIQVGRQWIAPEDLSRLTAELRDKLPQESAGSVTLFEFVTVLALRYFTEQRCDLVIWETGLGGRLDATNIVTPLASVITNIGHDHQQWLGDTLAKIAAEKAGIIKPGVPVITAEQGAEALPVIERFAREQNAPLTKLDAAALEQFPQPPQFLGAHQRANAALAAAVIDVLQGTLPVSSEQMAAGFAAAQWPGRLQRIYRSGKPQVLLDGAHNLEGIQTLCAALRDLKVQSPTLILGMLGDKDWREMCRLLLPLAGRVFAVPVESERAVAATDLAAECQRRRPDLKVRSFDHLPGAIAAADDAQAIVIAGSLYLIGTALAEIDPTFKTASDERALNEWRGKGSVGSKR